MTMHRRIRVGSLATLHMLDTRQHRSDQIPGDAWQHDSVARANRARTMLGDRQQRWLHDGLVSSTTTWNVVVQQVIAGRLDVDTDGDVHNVDTWDGYPAAQQLLYDALATTANPIVLTGDLHAGYALDIRAPLGAHRAGHHRHRVRRNIDQQRRRRHTTSHQPVNDCSQPIHTSTTPTSAAAT